MEVKLEVKLGIKVEVGQGVTDATCAPCGLFTSSGILGCARWVVFQ